MVITSLDNKKVKEIVKLRDKKYRDKMGLFVVETENLVREAYKNNLLLEVYKLEDYSFDLNIDTFDVSVSVMNKIKGIGTSKVIGVCKRKDTFVMGDRILLLDGVSDPGNLGTIIRSSLAFNIDTVVLSNTCCDLYNEKVVRATEGAIFYQNITRMDLEVAISFIKDKGIKVYGTDVVSGIDVSSVREEKFAVVIGNEGNGISSSIKELVDCNIYIAINSLQESLNVGVATSIIIYELNKNRGIL